MTHVFQVGDIVRINEPTAQDIQRIEQEDLEYGFKRFVGQTAVVTDVFDSEHTIEYTMVRLAPCDDNYQFQLSDTNTCYWATAIYTVVSHLSLVHPSTLRTLVLSQAVPKPLANQPLPFTGTIVTTDFRLPNGPTITTGTTINALRMMPDGILVRFHTADDEWISYLIEPTNIIEQYFTTF